MIRPFPGAAFTGATDGDLRHRPARVAVAKGLQIRPDWATVRQVHGSEVVVAADSGSHGEADALVSIRPGLPLAVLTADCAPVVILGDGGVAVAHAGWRGIVAGVVEAARAALHAAGVEPTRAAIGPHIGSCCYEVGPEVADRFPGCVDETRWGAPSVDLGRAVAHRLGDLEVWQAAACTRCGPGYFSHRADGTRRRQAGIAWLATG